jgi:hypothetical protein
MALEMIQLGYDPHMVKALRGGSLMWEDLDYPLEGENLE